MASSPSNRSVFPPLPHPDPFFYQYGFGNSFQSESVEHSPHLPSVGNSPKLCPGGLYAELVSGSQQATRRSENLCSWVYRRHPSVAVTHWSAVEYPAAFQKLTAPCTSIVPAPALWPPLRTETTSDVAPCNFIEGLVKLGGGGDPALRSGYNFYQFSANSDMDDCAYCTADGSIAIIPSGGRLEVRTEFGLLHVQPREVVIVPRGLAFAVACTGGERISGFAMECFDGLFSLPVQGVVGSSGLANVRDFAYPLASEDATESEKGANADGNAKNPHFAVYHKLCDQLHTRHYARTIFDVVAWHGNYAPFKYDLAKFAAINTVTYDHMDPCIGTVLSVFPENVNLTSGASVLDLVAFVPQRKVAIDTFRPPNLHRNCMAEILGVISGEYEARPGILGAGGATMHNVMTPHGPLPGVYQAAQAASDDVKEPDYNCLAFMLEVRLPMKLTSFGAQHMLGGYPSSWSTFA